VDFGCAWWVCRKMGYNVVHYTLELGEDYVGRRYDAFFTGKPVDTLLKIENESKK
jgi:hypothetical protein